MRLPVVPDRPVWHFPLGQVCQIGKKKEKSKTGFTFVDVLSGCGVDTQWKRSPYTFRASESQS